MLAADVVALLTHAFDHITVADRGSLELQAERGEMPLQAKIGHYGRHDARLRQLSLLAPALRHNSHELIAVNGMAQLIDHDNAVGVLIESDANIRAQFACFLAQRQRRSGAHVAVDIEAVWLDADCDDLSAKLP